MSGYLCWTYSKLILINEKLDIFTLHLNGRYIKLSLCVNGNLEVGFRKIKTFQDEKMNRSVI